MVTRIEKEHFEKQERYDALSLGISALTLGVTVAALCLNEKPDDLKKQQKKGKKKMKSRRVRGSVLSERYFNLFCQVIKESCYDDAIDWFFTQYRLNPRMLDEDDFGEVWEYITDVVADYMYDYELYEFDVGALTEYCIKEMVLHPELDEDFDYYDILRNFVIME